MTDQKHTLTGFRLRIHETLFESESRVGRLFHIALIWSIIISTLCVILESVESIREVAGEALIFLEWTFTVMFTVEYGLRIISVRVPWRYMTSFYGIIDLMAILPTYLSILLPGFNVFLIARTLRLLRIFRIFKMVPYLRDAYILTEALKTSKRKIFLFVYSLIVLALIMGSMMYVIEGEEHGFTSIPKSMYWAVVTMSTVGYGDMTPKTPPGQVVAVILMLMGYGIFAVPTGIYSVELARTMKTLTSTRACNDCGKQGHDADAEFCKFCGGKL
jgi:voltage-gated potassium channel